MFAERETYLTHGGLSELHYISRERESFFIFSGTEGRLCLYVNSIQQFAVLYSAYFTLTVS